MKIAVIGWYGTETIGDRAILAGLINIFEEVFNDFEIKIGSLFPTLSQRTIIEDYTFYCTSAKNEKLSISIFDSTNTTELKAAIRWADLLIMGGGPLMDIGAMYMVEYAFNFAVKKNIKTAVLGCGIGPLTQQKYIKSTISIVLNSNLTIFRDEKSLLLYNEFNKITSSDCFASIDPALFTAALFNKIHTDDENETKVISVNFRDIAEDCYLSRRIQKQLFILFSDLLKNLSETYPCNELLLVPMHTFRIGGDDRYLLNRLAVNVNASNLNVQNIPLSLEETMNVYRNSILSVGMRFHSILLQTMLNGKNYIIDYTDINAGKIINLLHQLDAYDVYKNRYYSLSKPCENIFLPQINVERYIVDSDKIYKFKMVYIENLRKIFK